MSGKVPRNENPEQTKHLNPSWNLLFAFTAAFFSLASICLGQRQQESRAAAIDPTQAEKQAHALVAEMLLQKPENTNSGWLKIRDAKGQQRQIPMRFEIWSSTNSSTSVYEIKDAGPPSHEVKLTVIHICSAKMADHRKSSAARN
jgi:hypothetical protein